MASALALAGPLIGAAGSIFGGSTAQSAANTGAGQSLTGYNYLSANPLIAQEQTAAGNASTSQGNTQGAIAQLLGTAPVTQQTQTGFNNYLNSTGYQFQQQQGTNALEGSAAAKGILNSGSTAKALTQYGQGLAGQSFNNYLGQLQGLNTAQQGTANAGLTATGQVGQAGTTGGGNAGQLTAAGGAAMGNGITSGVGVLGGGVTNYLNSTGTNSAAGLSPVTVTPSPVLNNPNYFGSI